MIPSSVLESYLLLQLLRNMLLRAIQSLPVAAMARAWSTGKGARLWDYRAEVIDLGKGVGKVMSMGPYLLIR